MFKCDPTTRAELDASLNKLSDTAVIQAALGNNRRIVMKRDPNAAATDVWATGTVFRDIGSTGTLKIEGGRVVGLGRLKGTLTQAAADMATGSSVMRIAGNGRYIELTVGLSRAAQTKLSIPESQQKDYDQTVEGNFTDKNGLAIRPDFAISGKVFKPSGTGPAAPDLDADAPVKFRVWDYSVNEAAPTVAGVGNLSVRDMDIVLDNKMLAEEIGDVRVHRCADGAGVVLGSGGDCFRIAATLLVSHKGLNADNPDKPVYQVRYSAKPHGRWNNFPYKGTFDIANDTLALPAFKIDVMTADDRVLDVIEMYSTRTGGPGTGKAINNSGQTPVDWVHKPVQPYFTCQMTLKWDSCKIKPNSRRTHWMPPVEADALDGRNVTAFDAAPEQWPLVTDNYLANGLGNWRVSPKWSRKDSAGPDTNILDPNLNYDQMARPDYRWITQMIGYGYEPGSTGHHIWFMSPGGSRHDRAFWPTPLVTWISNPDGNRPHGNVPYKELAQHWFDCYHNEGCHYFTDLERGISLQREKVRIGNLCYNGTYYSGGNEQFTSDIPNSAIELLATQNAGHPSEGTGYPKDKYGRTFVNDYQRDNQHSYSNAATGVYLANSAMHILEAKNSFDSHICAAFGMTQNYFGRSELLTRQHAWHMGQFAQQWMVTTSDARTMSRAELEGMWVQHLHNVWDAIMPGYRAQNHVTWRFLKVFGMPLAESDQDFFYDNGVLMHKGSLNTDSKAFYMGQVFMFMKQTGSWDMLRAKSTKCAEILDFMIECLCKQSIDAFIDGGGRGDNNGSWEEPAWLPQLPPAFPWLSPDYAPNPAGWAAYPPPKGQRDWIRKDDGSLPGYIDGVNTKHFRAQFLFILKRCFPEYHASQPRLDQAITQVQGYYTRVNQELPNNWWHYRFPMMGIHQAPAVVGPITA